MLRIRVKITNFFILPEFESVIKLKAGSGYAENDGGLLKRQSHEIFDFCFFFINQLPLGPWLTP
jgi:hypothetical protein